MVIILIFALADKRKQGIPSGRDYRNFILPCIYIKEIQIGISYALSYNVMQYDGNSFYGDVVLDSYNMVYSDEDSSI